MTKQAKQIQTIAGLLRYCGIKARADYTAMRVKAFGVTEAQAAEMNSIHCVDFIIKA